MTNTTSSQSQAAAKQRRKGNGGYMFFLLLLLAGCLALAVVAFLGPARLAIPQEQVLGLLHGGIIAVDEQTAVECAPNAQGGTPQAITRTSRTAMFRDNTALVTIFSSAPASTQLVCQ
ncbi:MAG: hypothetical protein H7Z42_10585 [Roseiflexaceae bacterium]|nr:hypothetical protein [Roseiflexaceae bacterium]